MLIRDILIFKFAIMENFVVILRYFLTIEKQSQLPDFAILIYNCIPVVLNRNSHNCDVPYSCEVYIHNYEK